jgi:hypothetical protein
MYRQRRNIRVTICSLALAAVFHPSASPAAVTNPPSNQNLRQWVDQLSDPDPLARDLAESNLVNARKPAIELLRSAINDPRPEVQIRARRALRNINLFLLPGVSDEALSFAELYLSATSDPVHRKPHLNQLFAMQPQPNVVLTRLVPLEDDEDLRRQILYQLATGYREAIPRMLVDNDDLPGVMSVLNGSADMWGRSEAADDAVALFLTGQIDQQIAISEAEQINGDTVSQERAATRLCYMYRVCGKYDQALKYARLSRDQGLIFLVLQDQGDWSAAAKEPDDRWRDPIVVGGYRAAFERLAGHPQAGIDIMAGLSANAPNDADRLFNPSRIFLLNGMPERGIELMADQNPAAAFEMRVMRCEIPQAIEIAEKYENHPHDAADLAQSHEKLMQSLGELPGPATATSQSAGSDNGSAGNAWQEAVNDLNEKKYQAAADLFGSLWTMDHAHFDRLYLQGYALVQAGQTDRGKALIQKAEILPLGDPMARYQFAAELEAAGLTDVAEQQRDFALRTGGDFYDIGFCVIDDFRKDTAIDRRQWHAAADDLDRLCLMSLSTEVEWRPPSRMLITAANAHLMKACDAREHRDFATMDRELQMYQQYLPASADMVLEMVPALDAIGDHARADALFNAVYQKLNDICRKYPKSVKYLNQTAWMCACCDRKLDDAQKAAETDVRLQPNNWQVLDTLAEVRFRRGDRSGALALEMQAQSMTTDPYIAKQLKRFASAEIPPMTNPGVAPE